MGLRKWIKKQSGKRSEKAGRRKTEDQVGSGPVAYQAGQPLPARPNQPASGTTTSSNPTLQVFKSCHLTCWEPARPHLLKPFALTSSLHSNHAEFQGL